MAVLLVETTTVDLRARRFGRGGFRWIERNVVPDRVGDWPGAQDRGELRRVLDGSVLGAKAENRASLFGSDARKLEELRRIGKVDSHSVRHGRLLHTANAIQRTLDQVKGSADSVIGR